MSASSRRLQRIVAFSRAGVVMGKVHVEREREMFEQTDHSCYTEGWAVGYLAAMQTMAEFIDNALRDEA